MLGGMERPARRARARGIAQSRLVVGPGAGVVLGVLAFAGWWWMRPTAHVDTIEPAAATETPTVLGRTRTRSPSTGPRGEVLPIRRDPLATTRDNAYRPANWLAYSEAPPSSDPAADDRSPTLDRLLRTTEATPNQAVRIRAAWQAHEDGRRALVPEAHRTPMGDLLLDPRRVAELDRELDRVLGQEILDERQRKRLALEMPPPLPDEPAPPTE
jgi:hypothetical protein